MLPPGGQTILGAQVQDLVLGSDIEDARTFTVSVDHKVHGNVFTVGPLVNELNHFPGQLLGEDVQVLVVQEGGIGEDETVVAHPEGQAVVLVAAFADLLLVCPRGETYQAMGVELQHTTCNPITKVYMMAAACTGNTFIFDCLCP